MRAREIVDDIAFAIEMIGRAAVERVATGTLFNPMRRDLRVDPYPYYRQLRERDPVHRSFGASGWVLTRHDDILGVLGDRAFSSDERNWMRYRRMIGRDLRSGLPDPYADGVISMLRVDPPDHTRLRTLVSKAFTPRAVERLRPRIEAVVVELLDALAGQHTFDLMHAFASPLPVVIIGEMMGVAVADRERFRHWSNEAIRLLGDGTRADRRRAWHALAEMRAWLGDQIEARRREPCDDLLSALVAAEEAGDRLSERELFATCVLLLVAGNETTTNLIGNGVIALLRHPEQLARLRADTGRMPAGVEELVRFDSPVQITSRLVVEERELHGRRFRRGEQIVLVLGAGNRDPARFTEPDRLDVDRADARPLSFGHGLHYCLGAQLARLEAQIGLVHLLERHPMLRFADAPITWGDNMILRGPRVLPLAA
jgi:pimeloyl-[acyl-carrier protein] synthase